MNVEKVYNVDSYIYDHEKKEYIFSARICHKNIEKVEQLYGLSSNCKPTKEFILPNVLYVITCEEKIRDDFEDLVYPEDLLQDLNNFKEEMED